MLAPLFLVFALPLLAATWASLIARRALPLGAGGAAIWLTWTQSHDIAAAGLIGFGVCALAVFVLERLAESRATRSGLIVVETIAGAMLAMLAAYAVLGSGGMEGVMLIAIVGATGVAAAATVLGSRSEDGFSV
jgi:hypothetical protein